MRISCLLILFTVGSLNHLMAQTKKGPPPTPSSPAHQTIEVLEPRFRLFKTENIWTFIELDTQNGRVWQVQYSLDANKVKSPINKLPLALSGRNGRFTLYPTNNMWNFILVDQDNGGTWQIQFSLDPEKRWINEIGLEEMK